MRIERKFALILGSILSFVASAFSAMSAVYFAWRSAALPQQWPRAKATNWVYGPLSLALLLLGLSTYCLVLLFSKPSSRK